MDNGQWGAEKGGHGNPDGFLRDSGHFFSRNYSELVGIYGLHSGLRL